MSESDNEEKYALAYPNEDSSLTTADVLGELMAGAYAHGAWVRIHDVDLRFAGSSQTQNVWYVHPPNEAEPVEAVNLGTFRTASSLEEYLREFDPVNH